MSIKVPHDAVARHIAREMTRMCVLSLNKLEKSALKKRIIDNVLGGHLMQSEAAS